MGSTYPRSSTPSLCSDGLPEETKYLGILPETPIVTKLIVKYHHEMEGQEMGVNFTLNYLREKYFVVQGRQQVRSCIGECKAFRGCLEQQQDDTIFSRNWPSIKPGTWSIPEHPGTFRNIPEHSGTSRNIPEHPGTFRNIPEHGIIIIIMRRICKITFSTIK